MNVKDSREEETFPMCHKLWPGCLCWKRTGRYNLLLAREMAQGPLTQSPGEEHRQICKLPAAHWREAPTTSRCQADATQRWKGAGRAWQWDCLRKEGFGDTSTADPQHCTPKQCLPTSSCGNPVRYGSDSRSHSALLWRLQQRALNQTILIQEYAICK